MAENPCTPPTPDQRRFLEIREAAERRMLETVFKAIADAALPFEPTHEDYFTFTVQQVAFVRLCGGDPETLEGGDPEIGDRIVRNGRHIIDHYWCAGRTEE